MNGLEDHLPFQPDQVEAIKVVMARYFRFMDTKQWGALRALFAEDMTMWAPDDVPGAAPLTGADRVVGTIERVLGPSVSVHRGHTPEIEIRGRTQASAIWAMDDTVEFPHEPSRDFSGSGHYHAEYIRQDDLWLVSALTLRRLRLDRPYSALPPR